MVECVCEHVEIEWPEGTETWLLHDELPQRTQFIKCKQQVMLNTSTFNIVEHSMKKTSSDCSCALPSLVQQPNQIILLPQQLLVKHDLLFNQNKQLKEMNQLIKNPVFSESFSEFVSNGIDDFYYELGHSDTKNFSLKSTTISSSDSFKSCIIQLISFGIVLISFIFVSVAFGILDSYLNFNNATNTPYFVNNVLCHGINDLDWFRTTAVP